MFASKDAVRLQQADKGLFYLNTKNLDVIA